MRRKPGTLLPLERAVCVAAIDLAQVGVAEFHGYDLARRIADVEERRLLTAYGTLYRTLGRLEKMGLLKSHWEDPAIPARENRPGRRLYTITGAGADAARAARAATPFPMALRRRRLAPA